MTAVGSSGLLRRTLRSAGFLAPGPATEVTAVKKEEEKGITKEKLLSLARQRNLRDGRDEYEGLELFLPRPTVPVKSFASAQEIVKKRGFRIVPRPISAQKPPVQVTETIYESIPAARQINLARTDDGERRDEGWKQFRDFARRIHARVPKTAEKMTKRLILSREANEIRAATMATVKICERERKQSQIRPVQDSSVCGRASSQEFLSQQREAHKQLVATLQSQIVDKLAAAEIETIKLIEREAAYPKLTNEQLEGKLTKLKGSAQANFRPLELVRSMKVISLRHKKL